MNEKRKGSANNLILLIGGKFGKGGGLTGAGPA